MTAFLVSLLVLTGSAVAVFRAMARRPWRRKPALPFIALSALYFIAVFQLAQHYFGVLR